jgi:uncharacterized membrane protein YbhN (UPF0104 family)
MKTALAWLKLGISALLIWFIYDRLDAAQLGDRLAQLSVGVILGAIGLQLLSTLTAAWRWQLIQHWLGYPAERGFYLKAYFKGSLFNQLLPTSIGGDAYRILENGHRINNHKEAFYGVFIDRIAGLIGLLMLNGIALIWLPDLLPAALTQGIQIILLIGFAGAIFGLTLHRLPAWQFPLWSSLQTLSRRFAQVYHCPSSISLQLGLSILTHLFTMLILLLLGNALGLHFDLLVYMVVIPPIILLTLLPISFAGWGIREGAMLGIFALLDAPAETILVLSVVYGLTLIVSSLPGLWFFLRERQWWQQHGN